MNNDYTSVLENDINKKIPEKISYLFKLFKFVFKSNPKVSFIYMGLSIALSLIIPLSAWLWRYIIDMVMVIDYNTKNIITVVMLLVGYFIFMFISNLLDRYLYKYENIEMLSVVQQNRYQEGLLSKLYYKISKLSPEYMEVPKINDIIKRTFDFSNTSYGGDNLSRGIMISFYDIVAKFISIIAIGVSLYIFNPWLSLIIVVALLPTIYTRFVGERLNNKFKYDGTKIRRRAYYFQDLLLKKASKEVKTLNLFDYIHSKWKMAIDEYTIKQRKAFLISALLNALSIFIANSVSVIALTLAIILMTKAQLSIGELGAIFVLIQTLTADTNTLFMSIGRFIGKKLDASQYYELLELSEQKFQSERINSIDKIEAKNVSYRYPLTDKYVLKDVSFSLNKGEKVAFVGENGAGKTTFIKLFSGMVSASKGVMLVNGVDFKDVDIHSLYNNISAVFQQPAKYNTLTIKENILLGDTDSPFNKELYNNAIRSAGIAHLDDSLLMGKDVGGTELSGGEWQRIAIARGYYKNNNFMILDEPTSNLDPIAESEIFSNYIKMAKDKTVIFVTHRISAASLADRIVVFKEGAIVEDGTHDKLLAQNGEYTRLYKAQAEWYDR